MAQARVLVRPDRRVCTVLAMALPIDCRQFEDYRRPFAAH